MPILFRHSKPERRSTVPIKSHYRSYKMEIREDFNNRCGYCDDLDRYPTWYFSIDHFVPRNPNGWTHSIPDNAYTNLVYACHFCNSSKSNKWPTSNASICHMDWKGFVDPTSNEYTALFYRWTKGEILANSIAPAIYIHNELKLWLPIHSILWRLEKLENSINKLNERIPKISDPVLKNKAEELLKELKSLAYDLIANWIFITNA